jgi:predicted nucleotidyltransferase
MNSKAVIERLRTYEPELRAAGIVHLSLFGSTARNANRPDSDIDLLAAFDPTRQLSLLDIIHLENHLSDLLGAKVDLIEEGTLRPRIKESADKDILYAF